MTTRDRLAELSTAGVAVWLDDLSRERLRSGTLADLIRDSSVVGVTTNPTIFATALSQGDAYDQQIRELADTGTDVAAAIRAITAFDVQQACDLFRATWGATGGIDGRVSLEVDPTHARDTDATVDEAIDLWKTVDRPNLLVKIPATEQGLPAITRALAHGISVNVTLIFSVERYELVAQAYLDGLTEAHDNGHDLGEIMSVASFFVSRVDGEIDRRLEAIGTDAALALRGKAAVANSRLAYAAHEKVLAGDRWRHLSGLGATPQRPLWASTGVKNPDYPDTLYVSELVVAGTVNTMPAKTLQAFADHGDTTGDRVTGYAAEARAVFDDLQAVGIDVTDVFLTLENDGVAAFEQSWHELQQTVERQLGPSH
ncbi:transaldolase [Pseudonocardia pini]|uniref:transaldolase n=1 Tax=Pseudonocardia pini TaxID=2758030 RepID=UPI0015F11CF0|nr:transaldolase [Pseudonocardia pini]